MSNVAIVRIIRINIMLRVLREWLYIFSSANADNMLADKKTRIKNLEGTLNKENGGKEKIGWSGARLPSAKRIPRIPNMIQNNIIFFEAENFVNINDNIKPDIKINWTIPK